MMEYQFSSQKSKMKPKSHQNKNKPKIGSNLIFEYKAQKRTCSMEILKEKVTVGGRNDCNATNVIMN